MLAYYLIDEHLIGVFRRGNKPPVLPGENKKLQQKKNLCDIIVNGLATALLKNITEVFNNGREE